MYTGSKSRPIHVRTFWFSKPPLMVHRGIQHFIGVSPTRGEDRRPNRTVFLEYNAFVFAQKNFREKAHDILENSYNVIKKV